MRFMEVGCDKIKKVIGLLVLGILCINLFSCEKKQVEKEHVHTKVHVLKIEPSCISEGRIEYWYCSSCNKAFKDKEAKYEIPWESTKLPKTNHTIVEDEEVASTCETTGLTAGKHCSYCKEIIEEQKELLALGHSYDLEEGIWEWEGFESASFNIACRNDSSHKKSYLASITSTTTNPTCTESGKTIYTASVVIEDKEYQDQKEEVILPLEHAFDLENMIWIWKEDSSASAQIPCKNDSTHTLTCDATLEVNIKAPTCTTDGKRITLATISIEGQSFTDEKEVILPATGHAFDYSKLVWSWEGYDKATATVTCLNDESHKVSYDASITSTTKAPTCTEDGMTSYTATITIGGKNYTDEKQEKIAALKHDFNYEEGKWEWHEYNEATLYFTCKNDPSHLDSYSAQIQKETIAPTCVTEGKNIYTASVNVENKSYIDQKEEILAVDPTNHDYDYEHPNWTWKPIIDGYCAVLHITCKCEASTLDFEADTVTNILLATFEMLGTKEYRAEALINGRIFEDTKIEVLPIKQYASTAEEFYNLIEKEAYDITLSCDIAFSKGVMLEGQFAAIDLNEHTLSVPNSNLQFKATHSYIRNGYLVTDLDNPLGGYVLSSDEKANLLIESIITFGGVNIGNANALLRNVDITATLDYAVCAQDESKVIIESGSLRKNFVKETNSFLWIEQAGMKDETSYEASQIFLTAEVYLSTTVDASLYNPIEGIAPEYESMPDIEKIDVKAYLTSSLEFKCLSLTADLAYSKEELQEGKIVIDGKNIALDLKGYTLSVPNNTLIITSSMARIRNGHLFVLTDESTESCTVISIEKGCKAQIDHIQMVGSIKTENASLSLMDVVIQSPNSNEKNLYF